MTERDTLCDNSNSITSHMFLENVSDDLSEENFKKLQDATEWKVRVEVNGISLNLLDADEFFSNLFERNYENLANKRAEELFEERKQKFMSKNSSNAKLQKLKESVDKARNTLSNVEHSLRYFKI